MNGTGSISGRAPSSGLPVTVHFAQGKITAIEPGPVEASGYLSSGLIDLQVNGYAGHDLNSASVQPETVKALAKALLLCGVTTFLPTLVTASEAAIVSGLEAIAEARNRDPLLRHAMPYVHVEGPWISPDDGPRGAHPLEHVRAPNIDEVARWQRASGGLVGKVTLSPHYPETVPFVRSLVAQGVVVAIGHTAATNEQILAAVDAGARLSTHLGNGVAAVLPRHPNVIWSQLAEDRLTAGFIADGHHLSKETLKAMLRAKGLSRAYLVSDAAAPAGLPPGIYERAIGGQVELTADGRLGMVGTPYLAGAAKNLSQCIAGAIGMADISLAQALGLATVQPGAFVGGRGELRVGADADIIRFDWQPGDVSLAIDTVITLGTEVVG